MIGSSSPFDQVNISQNFQQVASKNDSGVDQCGQNMMNYEGNVSHIISHNRVLSSFENIKKTNNTSALGINSSYQFAE
jgi:hypothetical protein